MVHFESSHFLLKAVVAHALSAVCSSVLLHLCKPDNQWSVEDGLMSRFREVGCRSFAAHAHHRSSGRQRVSEIPRFSRSAGRQPLHQSGKVQARVFHVRRRETPHLFPAALQRWTGWPQSRRFPGSRLSSQLSGTTIPKKWRCSRGRWRRHRCKPEPLHQRHRLLRPFSSSSVRKKRLAGADKKIRQAAEALRQVEFEKAADIQAVAEAEAHVERLRAQSAQPSTTPSATPMQGVPVGMEAEVERLRAQVAGNFKDVLFYPILNFWPFLGRPLQDIRVLPHPIFSSMLGRPHFFSC